jgi:hypothetical protein
MLNFNKFLFLISLTFLSCLIQLSYNQPSEYEKILSQLKQDSTTIKSIKDNQSEPNTSIQIGKWWCDSNFKLNSVREDVMTNHNFNS